MRLKQYLIESDDYGDIIIKGINLIYDKCMPFIKEITKQQYIHLMYSGRKGKTEPHFIGKVRTNRKPSDTPKELTRAYDSLFKKRFGWNARTNSIFCSGNVYDVIKYGKPYIIFPIGKFKYLWSPEIDDMYSSPYVNGVLYNIATKNKIPYYDIDHISIDIKNKKVTTIIKYLDKDIVSKYTDKDLNKALLSNNEIMINCKKYIALDQNYFEGPLIDCLSTNRSNKPSPDFLQKYNN